jgi:hypothetical protein
MEKTNSIQNADCFMSSFTITQHLKVKLFCECSIDAVCNSPAPKVHFIRQLYSKQNCPKNFVQYCNRIIVYREIELYRSLMQICIFNGPEIPDKSIVVVAVCVFR